MTHRSTGHFAFSAALLLLPSLASATMLGPDGGGQLRRQRHRGVRYRAR